MQHTPEIDSDPHGGPRTDTAYQAKPAALADTIGVLAPDVLAVQEVGDPDALADLAARAGGGWHLATANPDGRGIRVGFLSRPELTDVEQVLNFPVGSRPIQVDDTAATSSTNTHDAVPPGAGPSAEPVPPDSGGIDGGLDD